ncbi:MAG: YdcF family protein [Caldilineales bacterium]
MKRLLHGAFRLLVAILLMITLVISFLAWQVNRVGSQERAQPADVIVILGARVEADGSPSSDLLSRTYHAMDLYNAGYAPAVICAGGAGGDALAAGAVACRFAVEQLGLPAAHAITAQQGNAWTTAGEAASVTPLMTERGWHSAILVSHPLHLYRAAWLFRRQGVVVFTSPTNTELSRIALPLRLWYSLREAGGVVLTIIEDWPLMDRLLAWLSDTVYGN